MRLSICIALLSFAASAAITASPASAQAEEWCGFHDKNGAAIYCGYSTEQVCQKSLGDQAKDAFCIPDPSFASLDGHRIGPIRNTA
jgi:hypothetical protein